MDLFHYKFAPRHLPFIREQVWETKDGLDVYPRLSNFEHEQVKDYIGSPRVVMDVGCGLGRAGIYLNYILGDPSIHFILADTTGYTKNTGAFEPEQDEFYNDLFLTEDFARLNGLNNFQIFDTRKDDWSKLPKIDLITSRCSFGMHVPIERYMPQMYERATDNCTMIFGTRARKRYGGDLFKDLFEEVLFLKQRTTPPFPHQDWLILRNKKLKKS